MFKVIHIPSGKHGMSSYISKKIAYFNTEEEANYWLNLYPYFNVWEKGFILHYLNLEAQSMHTHRYQFEIVEVEEEDDDIIVEQTESGSILISNPSYLERLQLGGA